MRKLDKKISAACQAAAVVVYVRCAVTKQVFLRPAGTQYPAWFIVNAN